MWYPKFLIKEVDRHYTDAELLSMVAERLGDTDALGVPDAEVEENIYKGLASIDGLADLLRDTMVKDMRRYFAIPNGPQGDRDRDVVRGGFSRTAHWMARIIKVKA